MTAEQNADTVRSADLQPGQRLQHRGGVVVTLARRKNSGDAKPGFKYLPGWWVEEGGGLADLVIDDPKSDWTLL